MNMAEQSFERTLMSLGARKDVWAQLSMRSSESFRLNTTLDAGTR